MDNKVYTKELEAYTKKREEATAVPNVIPTSTTVPLPTFTSDPYHILPRFPVPDCYPLTPVCPGCGRCPYCGRGGNYPIYPIYPTFIL